MFAGKQVMSLWVYILCNVYSKQIDSGASVKNAYSSAVISIGFFKYLNIFYKFQLNYFSQPNVKIFSFSFFQLHYK